jgi:hypothetical protein
MKDWKLRLVQNLVDECREARIVSLYDVARAAGYNHIRTQDARDILHAAAKLVPGYCVAYDPKKSIFTGGGLAEEGNGWLEGE